MRKILPSMHSFAATTGLACVLLGYPAQALHAQTMAPASTLAPSPAKAAAQNSVQAMLNLMAQRLHLSEKVAQSKWNSQLPIADTARETQVVLDFMRRAKAMGINEMRARHFILAQIEASKQVQTALHQTWRNQGQGKFEPGPDLAKEVRPQLDTMSQTMLEQLQGLQARPFQSGAQGATDAHLAAEIETQLGSISSPWPAALRSAAQGLLP